MLVAQKYAFLQFTQTRFLIDCDCFDTAISATYTLSLHDALPICSLSDHLQLRLPRRRGHGDVAPDRSRVGRARGRSEAHTSELQSHSEVVCRLLLEKKKPASITGRRPRLAPYGAATPPIREGRTG